MSGSNPFRRNDTPRVTQIANPGLSNDRPDVGSGLPSLKVEVPQSTRGASITKRVRIASPPVPISPDTPASYASTPEVTRYSNFPGSLPPADSENIPYAQALASNPFHASFSDGEQDDMDEEVLENTRRNSALGMREESEDSNISISDPVRATLARFAGVPRQPVAPLASESGDQSETNSSKSSRPALDVDAFKRLLLTGESGLPADQALPVATHIPLQTAVASDTSSSTADTASVSQHSLFEPPAPVLTDTPRTSHEMEREEVIHRQRSVVNPTEIQKQPSVLRPRQGVSLSDSSPSPMLSVSPRSMQARQSDATASVEDRFISSPTDLNKPLPPPPTEHLSPLATNSSTSPVLQAPASSRRPPTPPLTRRRSQARSQSMQERYNPSSKKPPAAKPVEAPSLDHQSAAMSPKAPPPPPARRQKRASDIGEQTSEAVALGEGDFSMTSTQPTLSPVSSMTSLPQPKPQPPPSRTPSAAKRMSRASTGSPAVAPPLPPPRRVPGSRRSSCDGQPAGLPRNSRISVESRGPSTDTQRNMSDQSTSNDILADLAALQTEVDALRDRQGQEAGNTK